MITLSGLIPDQDIKIEYTGLRPGEKLYEELFGEGELVLETAHKKISMVIDEKPGVDSGSLMDHLLDLEVLALGGHREKVLSKMRELVPSFSPMRTPRG
jgi:FlaA1/EpsC-like NDP-sugar epimerase